MLSTPSLGDFFLEKLDAVVSQIHLKMAYGSDIEKPIVLDVDLRTKRHICDVILRNLITTTSVSEEARGGVNVVDLHVRKYEIPLEDERVRSWIETLRSSNLTIIIHVQ